MAPEPVRGRSMCAPHNNRVEPTACADCDGRSGDDPAPAARSATPRCSSMSTAPCWKSRRGRSWSSCRRPCRSLLDRLARRARRRAGARSAAARSPISTGCSRRGKAPRPACMAPNAAGRRQPLSGKCDEPADRGAARRSIGCGRRSRRCGAAHARRLARRQGPTLALHYRAAPGARSRDPRPGRRWVPQDATVCLRLIAGKMVVELQPRSLRQGRGDRRVYG